MKRLSQKRKCYLLRQSTYRMKNRLSRYHRLKKIKSVIKWQNFVVPEHVSLLPKHIHLLIELIEKLYQTMERNPNAYIRIDFSRTEKMYSDGTLYLWACISDLTLRYRHCHFSIVKPSDYVVEQVLYQVGIAALLGRRKYFNNSTFHPSVRHWHVAYGENVDLEKANNIFDSFKGKLTPELSKSVYAGISEAMTNCIHHAYEDIAYKKWWMFSREDTHSKKLQVVFCDLGIGIPKSLYQNANDITDDWLERLTEWLHRHISAGKANNDALKIKAAIEIGRTRTKLPNRGKGLKQMVSTLDKMGNGEAFVEIISGNGRYTHRSKNQQSIEKTLPLSNNKKYAIRGTMIQWSIPLPNQENTQ